MVLGAPLAGAALGRWGPRPTAVTGTLLVVLGTAGLAQSAHTGAPGPTGAVFAVIGAGFVAVMVTATGAVESTNCAGSSPSAPATGSARARTPSTPAAPAPTRGAASSGTRAELVDGHDEPVLRVTVVNLLRTRADARPAGRHSCSSPASSCRARVCGG